MRDGHSTSSGEPKRVLVIGGGISGLVAAFELSEVDDIDVTVIEASQECGGKMRGRFNPATQRFEEHSIRSLSSTYFSLFDVFHRANILDRLSPVDEYLFYRKADGARVALNRSKDVDFFSIAELVRTFDLSTPDMLNLGKSILHHVNASEDERAELTHRAAGDVIGIDGFDQKTQQFIVNWFGILTGARMHSKAVDILDSFLLMFMPTSASPQLPPGETSKSYCFNRPTSEVVDAFVACLELRGVKILTHTSLASLNVTSDGIAVAAGGSQLPHAVFDAVVMAVPHEVIWQHGLIDSPKPFKDEWSFGSQFPMQTLPENLKPFAGRSYNLCFDAPWNIVFQLQHNESFWRDVNFPAEARFNLSATCSSPHNKGALFLKPFEQCTPQEALHEVLFQLGVTDEAERCHLVTTGVVDPIYYEFTDEWSRYENLASVEMGAVHDDGRRWISKSQIYVRSSDDPDVGPKTVLSGVFLAGELVTVQTMWKIPTMEQAAASGKQAAQHVLDYLGLPVSVNLSAAHVNHQLRAKIGEALVGALSIVANAGKT